MGDLNSFFAKKDKKKKNGLQYSTMNDIERKIEEESLKREKVKKKRDPDWKEFEERKKDYTGLKIQNVSSEDITEDLDSSDCPWSKTNLLEGETEDNDNKNEENVEDQPIYVNVTVAKNPFVHPKIVQKQAKNLLKKDTDFDISDIRKWPSFSEENETNKNKVESMNDPVQTNAFVPPELKQKQVVNRLKKDIDINNIKKWPWASKENDTNKNKENHEDQGNETVQTKSYVPPQLRKKEVVNHHKKINNLDNNESEQWPLISSLRPRTKKEATKSSKPKIRDEKPVGIQNATGDSNEKNIPIKIEHDDTNPVPLSTGKKYIPPHLRAKTRSTKN